MAQRFNARGNNLATIARETGYPVVEVPGWTTHDHGPMSSHVYGVVCHHTAGPEPERTSSNYPSLNVVRNGYSGLPGPLSQYGLGFDGTIYVISSGLCYHAGTGSWRGVSGNSRFIGIEAEDGGDGDWMPAQLDCYPRLVAVICQFLGADAGWVCGHKEWTSRKIDPAGINMDGFRQKVAYYLNNPSKIKKTEDEDMALTDDDIKKIANQTATALLRRDGIDVPWTDPENRRWQVRNALAGIWRQATHAHEVSKKNHDAIVALAKAVDAMADGLPNTVRAAVRSQLKDIEVTLSYSIPEENQPS